MANDSWTDSYRREQGKVPDEKPARAGRPDEISPGVMSRGPVRGEADGSLEAEPGTAEQDRAIARGEQPAATDRAEGPDFGEGAEQPPSAG